jgi:hypothetical protein
LHCTIDGQPKPPELLACQERQFGQAATRLRLLPYEIRMDRAEFVTQCGPFYRDHVGYEKAAEPFYRPGADAVIDRWHRLRYPELNDLVDKDPELVQYLLRWRIGSSLLRFLFPLAAGKTRFILNTLDTIEVGKDGVTLAGRAWEV